MQTWSVALARDYEAAFRVARDAQLLSARTADLRKGASELSSAQASLVAKELDNLRLLIPKEPLPVGGGLTGAEQEALGAAAAQLADLFCGDDAESVASQLAAFIRSVASRHKVLGARVLSMLCSILVGVLSNFVYAAIVARDDAQRPRVVRSVERRALRAVGGLERLPAGARVVVARSLDVRGGPRRVCSLVGRLQAGDLVVAGERRGRGWVHMRMYDAEGTVVVEGWVFRRYLRPLQGSRKRH
jgi:hypothetical protein